VSLQEVLGAFDPVWFAAERLGFHADAKQRQLLESDARRVVLNCSRQWGKSTVTAVKIVHRAMFAPGSLTLVLAPSERQSALLVAKARALCATAGEKTRKDGQNSASIVLANGSGIVGLPGKEQYLRGYSAVSMLIVDEAARVDDELYRSMRPMLATTNGAVWLLSTPHGARGFFHRVWTTGDGEEWLRILAPATECPRIRPEFLEQERRAQGERMFRQEYLCEFTEADDSLFGSELIRSVMVKDDGLTPGRKEWWKR
jgi:hypothetical protein